MQEMNLRQQLTANKTLNQMRNEIKQCLEAEREMSLLIEQISHLETRTEAMKK